MPENDNHEMDERDDNLEHRSDEPDSEQGSEQPDSEHAGSGQGAEPGHRGNDTSEMKLLQTDLAEIAKQDPQHGRDPIPGVQEALKKLEDIDVPD